MSRPFLGAGASNPTYTGKMTNLAGKEFDLGEKEDRSEKGTSLVLNTSTSQTAREVEGACPLTLVKNQPITQ